MVLVEPPVREPLGVVVQQAASLVMSPGGAGRAVGGGAETENIQSSGVWGTPVAHLSV